MYFDNGKDTETRWDWNEGELEEMRAWAKKEPGRCFPLDYCPGGADFGGYFYVWGCPCNRADKFEQFIWDRRHQIASYLEKRTKAEASDYWREQTLRSLQVAELMMAEPKQ
jgi:hypothetical protein